MRQILFVLGLLTLAGACFAAEVTTIDDFNYPDATAMRAAWVASMGSPPAEVMPHDNGMALKMPCPFSDATLQRASFDKTVKLDLSHAGAITFDFYCDDPMVVGNCSIYFHSGAGWYHGGFGAAKGWKHIVLGKGTFGTEDAPVGWDKIDTIRVSAWRGKAADTFCGFDNLQARTEDIAVICGLEAEGGNKGTKNFADQVTSALTQSGLPYSVLTDRDVEGGALEGHKLALFAYSPNLSGAAVDKTLAYLKSGGKIICFYGIPAPLAEALGVTNINYRGHQKDGDFADVVFNAPDIVGLPPTLVQNSWNIDTFTPAGHNARVIGTWRNDAGQMGGPAVVLSDNGAYMGHVLTGADPVTKQAFVMAMVGHFIPTAWQDAAQQAVARAVVIGPFADRAAFDAFLATAQKDPGYGAKVKAAMAQAAAAEAEANKLLADKRYPEVQGAAQKLHDAMAQAYFVAHTPRTAEFRAVWNHSGTGDCGTWDEAMQRLKAGGFNAVVPNMLWGGVAYYDSKLLPHGQTFIDKGDQIAQCVAAGKKYGIEVHPWKVNWNLTNAPKEFVDKMRAEGRLLVNDKGQTEPWLCASNPLNLQLEIDTMLEVARNYDVDGIHFDYIRYPHNNGCYCDGCRQRFEAKLSHKVQNWPADCQGALREEWMHFRCDNITTLVRTVSEIAHKEKPWIKVSAAVFSNYPACKYDVGQDWVSWCKAGYLDFVCPMNYFDSDDHFKGTVANQLDYVAGSVPLYSGIGAFINTDDAVVGQMEMARNLGADGFILFVMGKELAVNGFPKFAQGITSQPAILPHTGPVVRFEQAGGGLTPVQVSVVGPGQHRQAIKSFSGRLELQDMTGKKLADLGELPATGKGVEVKLSATPNAGGLRLAAVGTMTFADGSTQPFVVRSKPYAAAK